MTDIALVACHYNPAGYTAPRVNLMRFIRQMQREAAPLFGVEGYFKGQEPMTAGIPGWRQVLIAEHGKMWQKEALLNAAAMTVPPMYTKIVALDADVTFANPAWVSLTSAALDDHLVIQPFSMAVFEGPDGREERRVAASATVATTDPRAGHPGFAIAARRELWDDHNGLYPYAIMGAGDTVAMAAFKNGQVDDSHESGCGATWEARALRDAWMDGVREWTKGRIGHIPGELWHSYHGTLANRSYVTRNRAIASLNPSEHLQTMPEGWLCWTSEAPADMMLAVRDYYTARQEDAE